MNHRRHYFSSSRLSFLLLDFALIAASYIIITFSVHVDLQSGFQFNVFFVLFALIWGVVSGFRNFIFRVDGLVALGRKTGNLLNAFLLHAALLGGCVVIFNLSGLPLLYTYCSTALLIILSRTLLLQVMPHVTAAHVK